MTKNLNFMLYKQIIELNKTATQVASKLDISYGILCKWIQKNQVESFVGSGNFRSDERAIHNMKKRLRNLEEGNAI